jgi:flagellar biosynthesis protein FliR
MFDITNWMMVFLRVSAMLAVFPVFSAANFPVQLRLALGALLAALICPVLPGTLTQAHDIWGLVGSMAVEVGIGLALGFASRMIFYALDIAAAIISTEIGLQLPSSLNPMSGAQTNSTGTMIGRTSQTFVIALQLSAPIMAVSFIISLVFAVLGRAVPQMNVFHESFVFRILVGLSIFGLTMQLMSQHIVNYLRRLPEDVLQVAQILGAG